MGRFIVGRRGGGGGGGRGRARRPVRMQVVELVLLQYCTSTQDVWGGGGFPCCGSWLWPSLMAGSFVIHV